MRLIDPRRRRASARGRPCNTMARPAFRKVDRPEEGGPRLVHLDRDRRLVEAAQADPARFEALYRKYLAQVYSYAFYELRDHHEAEDATERTFLAALTNLAPLRGARPARRRRGRLDVPGLALPDRAQRRRRAPPSSGPPARGAARGGRRGRGAVRPRSRRDAARRGCRRVACRRPAPRRSTPGGDPALRRRDVHGGDRRRPRPLRGRRPGPHPSGAAERRARPRRRVAVTGPDAGRDEHEVDALVTDRYLEALLAAHARGADRRPPPPLRPTPIRAVADRLARDLPRLHPSFRFEEALAARLAEVAARMRLPAAAGAEGLVVPLPGRPARREPATAAATVDDSGRRSRRVRAPAADRRRADLGGAVARRAPPTSPGASIGRPSARWPGPSAPWPGRGPSDADQAAVVPRPPRRLPGRPVDEVPAAAKTMLFNKQLDKALRVCPTCGHHFRLSAARSARAAARPGLVGGARRRPAVGRSARVRRPEALPGPAGGGAGRDRACATRRCGAPAALGGTPRRHLRHGLRVHGRIDGRRRRREGHPRRRTRAGGADAARHRQRLGRRADAGGHARADAAGQDARPRSSGCATAASRS